MGRAIALTIALVAVCATASGDQLMLRDGRTLTGKVTVNEDTVLIEMPYGTLSYARDEVTRIEFKATPGEIFARRLEQLAPSDVDALYELAQWGVGQGLSHEARELYQQIIKAEPNHLPARHELGYINIDRQWRRFDEAMELARGKLAARNYMVLPDLLDRLEAIADSPGRKLAVRELLARTQLQSEDFAAATSTFDELAQIADEPAATRYATIVDILRENDDGMYVLPTPYPPSAVLLQEDTRYLPAGPASLADPLALEAALRDRAREAIIEGRQYMENAAAVGSTDAGGAEENYRQAGACFERANAVVDGIAHSYQVEIVRRRIALIRRGTDAKAEKFDTALAQLGKKEVSARQYRSMVRELIGHIDDVRSGLQDVVKLAGPYPRELVMEIGWAQQDLNRIEAMRKVLSTELDASR